MRRGLISVTVAALAFSPSPSGAYASDCKEAHSKFSDAFRDVQYALNRYVRCMNNTDGTDDCSIEFRRLKYAQGDIETASSDIQSNC